MPRPNAIEAAQRFRGQLAAQEADSALRMGRIYNRIYANLKDDAQKLADEIAAMGDDVSKAKILRLARTQSMLNQVADQAGRFGTTIADEVANVQSIALQQGIDDALKLMEFSLPDLSPELRRQIIGSFNRLPVDAIEAAAGLLGEDSPLTAKLDTMFGEAVSQQVGDHIVDGIAAGMNPRRIARLLDKNITGGLGTGLSWAMTSVRTAQVKSYQIANHATYAANSDIVPEWIWWAELGSDRTCMSCVAQHGTAYPYTETLNDHHNGRCVPIPKTITYKDLGLDVPEFVEPVETGPDWFARQSESTQRKLMGPGKFEAWKAGKFDFRDLSKKYNDPVYGELLRESSLKDLISGGAVKRGKQFDPMRGLMPGREDFTPEYYNALEEFKFTQKVGEFAPGELAALQDKVNFEFSASKTAKRYGYTPGQMSSADWADLADRIKDDAGRELRFATQAGREAEANRAAGRTFIGGRAEKQYIQVGGKTVEKQWTGGSRKAAAEALKTINAQTKSKATSYMERQLVEMGYTKAQVQDIGYTSARQLLSEIGNNAVLDNKKIAGLTQAQRASVIDAATQQAKRSASSIAYNPRTGKGLDLWVEYEKAMVKAEKYNAIQYPPELVESVVPDFVKYPGGKKPVVNLPPPIDTSPIDF